MTVEESKVMWEIEKSNSNENFMSKDLKKLYKIVDKMINEGVLLYSDFTNDMIDAITDSIVSEGDGVEDSTIDRQGQMDRICNTLAAKYEEKYNRRESVAGDTELSEDNTELQTESGLCESECSSGESTGDTEEIG